MYLIRHILGFFYTNLFENLLTYVLVNIKNQNLTKLLFEVLYLFFSVISNDAAYKKLAFLLLNFGISWDTVVILRKQRINLKT